MVACLWCHIGCLFFLLLLWCRYLLADLTAIFWWVGLPFRVNCVSLVHWCSSSLNFVVKFYIAKCYFIYIDDIAQQKMYMSRNLWWASRCLFLSVFKFESNYNLICFEFWLVLFPMLFFVSRRKVLRYCCWFWLGLLDVVIYSDFWWTEAPGETFVN